MTSAVQLASHPDPTLPTTLIVTLAGELDYTNTTPLHHQIRGLLEGGYRHLLLDVGGLTFCDSTGIGIFLTLRTLITDRGGLIVLSDLPPHLRRIFETTGLVQHFTLQPTRADALALLRTTSSPS
ncbi:STAS domain-containing protein [Streptosporangium sp. NPDC002721]|uniref:STAS domain-containing protein n=1 Tax=Streptosporangium sp. NPDC002721 TaxID=3366188 RepID=UPI00369C3C4A